MKISFLCAILVMIIGVNGCWSSGKSVAAVSCWKVNGSKEQLDKLKNKMSELARASDYSIDTSSPVGIEYLLNRLVVVRVFIGPEDYGDIIAVFLENEFSSAVKALLNKRSTTDINVQECTDAGIPPPSITY